MENQDQSEPDLTVELPQEINTAESFLEAVTSRRFLMGSGLGAILAGAGVLNMLPSVEAAPSDIKGSPNIAVKSFRTKNGTYILYSDGSISGRTAEGQIVAKQLPRYGAAPGWPAPNFAAGKPKGSPNVAVDVIQDGNSTFVLFSDGSVKSPSMAGFESQPIPNLHFAAMFYNGRVFGTNLQQVGSSNAMRFDPAFKEVPFFFHWVNAGEGLWNIYLTGHPGAQPVTRTNCYLVGNGMYQAGLYIGTL